MSNIKRGSPFFSVCIPTYNRPEAVAKALQSVLSQSYTDFEVLIHDNSPSTETEKIVREAGDKRVRYTRHTSNIGMIANWNSLVMSSQGDYIKFLNDDDILHPSCLSTFSDAINRGSGASVYTCRALYKSDTGELSKEDKVSFEGSDFYVHADELSQAFRMNTLPLRTPTHTAFCRTTAQNIGGFSTKNYYCVDVYSFYIFAKVGGAYFIESTPQASFTDHADQAAKHIPIETRLNDLSNYIDLAGDLKGQPTDLRPHIGAMALKELALMMRAFRVKECIRPLTLFVRNPSIAAIGMLYRSLSGRAHKSQRDVVVLYD